MFFDRRHVPREPIALSIVLPNGATAVTRDVGPHGMYLRMPLDQHLDDWVRLEIDLARSGLHLSAVGQVLRTEPGERSVGVALRLHSLQLRVLD